MAHTPYEKYLRRLKSKIQQNPFYATARRAAFAQAPRQATFDTFLRKENVPVGVASQIELESQAQRQRSLTGVVERAGVRDVERKERLGAEIDKTQLIVDEAERRRKDKLGDTLLQAGGAVIGAVAGSFVGMPLQGAQLGAAAGQILGGFSGDNSEDITIGLGSAIQTFSQISTTQSNKLLGEKALQLSDKFQTLSRDQRQLILQQLQMGIPIEEILRQYGDRGALI